MIELRELLSRLQGVEEKGGGQFMARCPCHDDKRASLAVRMGEKGIVLNCLAHCETADILDALGLSGEGSETQSGKSRTGFGCSCLSVRTQTTDSGRFESAEGGRELRSQAQG